METLSHDNVVVLFLSLGVLLLTAHVFGEIAQRFRQPAVLGELLAGVLLGPTVLGAFAPGVCEFLFPMQGLNAVALETISTLAIALFLLVAGMEVDLSTIWKQGRVGLKVGLTSVAVPFAVALALALAFPNALGRLPSAEPLVFGLFFAIAISISALPIIAKTLMDMGLYRSELGMIVVSAAILNDLVGWIIFAVILGLLASPSLAAGPIALTVLLTVVFVGGMLTVGRWLIHKAMPFVQAYTRWPGGELTFALVLGLFGAACTEWIGIHAIFGAFIVGVAVGDSSHLRERSRVVIDNFISFIFAPVFFAGIGLRVDFLAHFDPALTASVLAIACVCKISGGALGARWGGLPRREAWTVGFATVSVGAMGIIVGMVALQAGIIDQRLFVALIIMAMATSMLSGPLMRLGLGTKRKSRLQDALSSKLFVPDLQAQTRRHAIEALAASAAEVEGLDPQAVTAAAWSREEAMGTGIGNGVAIPHARIPALNEPRIVVGISAAGLDFDAPDDIPAHVIFLILTPQNDPCAHLDIVSGIARLFRDRSMLDRFLTVGSFTDFLALVQTGVQWKR